MVDLTLLVGNAAIVCTIASNFAGLPTCLDMVRKKSTSGVSPLPFLSGAVGTSLWLQYGLLIGDGVVTAVNLMAVFLQSCYLGSYCYATAHKAGIVQWVVSSVLFLLSTHVYSFYVADLQTAVQTVGLLSCSGSVAMCASPLAGLKDVLQTRSTQHLPFLIIASTFATTTLWYVYGLLVGDSFIKVPNLIGSLLSSFQLSLFAFFNSTPTRPKKD